MAAGDETAGPRFGATLRDEERVTSLELFFDLVFVLAITQCTALMSADPTWGGLARGLLALGVLWWCLIGYAWLTSVVDPEEGLVRLAMFAAMAAILVAALAVPHAFGSGGLWFAGAHRFVPPRRRPPRRPESATAAGDPRPAAAAPLHDLRDHREHRRRRDAPRRCIA